jgi:starch phosphorylase
MKLMINGALTMGTLDGANVEMAQAVGEENIYIFGLRTEEVDELWKKGYYASDYYNNSVALRRTIHRLGEGFNGHSFQHLVNYLLMTQGIADPYMCLADFDDYCFVHEKAIKDYPDREKWNKMSLENIAGAGFFAADRSIADYAEKIWHMTPVK